MTRAASRHVAIWIDRREAILFAFEVDPFDGSVPHRPGDDWSQYRVDARSYPLRQEYYDAVLSHLGSQDEIWILGPGQMKRELRQRIEQQGGLKGKVVGLHDACGLATVEVVFPSSGAWRAEKTGEAQVDTPIPRLALRLAERVRTKR
jgi:hypothetical protein